MKKVISLILTVLLVVSLAACSGWQSNVSDYSGEVSSNGGFAVVKGDYVYLVNGSIDYTAENTFGKVVHGGIIRVKTSDIGTDFAKAEMVVPKMVYTEYSGEGSGIFIAGDYVYYPTPSDKKSNIGTIKNTEMEFWRTKLDGTDSTIILTVDTLDTPYRFFADGSDVYLTVYKTVKNDDDVEESYLITYDAKGNEVAKSKKVNGYALGGIDCKYAYYVHTAYNETLEAEEKYNELYRYSLKGDEEVMILSGEGGYRNDAEVNGGIGTQGATFEIIKVTEKVLYLSLTYVDTSVVSSTLYFALNEADIKTEAVGGVEATKLNYDSLVLLDNGTNDATYVFVPESIYVDSDCIVYFDEYYGIVKFDYNDRDKLSYGLSFLYNNDKFAELSFVYEFYNDGIMYFSDSNGYYYSLDLGGLVNLSTGETLPAPTAELKRITYEDTFRAADVLEVIFGAEIVGDYMLYLKKEAPYYSYVFSVDTKAFDKYLVENNKTGLDEEQLEREITDFVKKLSGYDKKTYQARLAQRLAVMANEDVGKLINYYVDFITE